MLDFFRRLLGRKAQEQHREEDKATVKRFRKKYADFRKLLDANAALAELMAEMEVRLGGNTLFGLMYVQSSVEKSLRLCQRMVGSLQSMSSGRYKALTPKMEEICTELQAILYEKGGKTECPHFVMPFSDISMEHVDWVGGKNANLGELHNKAGVSVPRGFAVTVAAYQAFMEYNSLELRIQDKLKHMNVQDRDEMSSILAEVRTMIEEAPLPPQLVEALDTAWVQCFGGDACRIAVRSSAQVEDGDKSFAGQFISELYVTREDFGNSYKRVVASLFSPSATIYRLHQGIPLSDSSMAVVCMEMVDAVASGVAYSHDPVDLLNDTVVINGVWGQGKYAVDGIVPPDLWVFTRDKTPVLVRRKAGLKTRMLALGASGQLEDTPVPEDLQKVCSLDEEEAEDLAGYILHIEKAFGCYQDVEWVKNDAGQLLFLQSRPFDTRSATNAPKPPQMEHYTLLVRSEDIACKGIGCGPVVKPETQEDLVRFPQGGILVAAHSNAQYAQVMDKVQGIITEAGGVTGHMASICREFHVPCIVSAAGAMQKLETGQTVTLDAFNGYVYAGEVPELLPLRLNIESVRLEDTAILSLLRDVSRFIIPLHLTDPNAAEFSPDYCKTLHDIMRFAHEYSYQEMFSISDDATSAGRVALKLSAPLPIDLHLIDLDGGVKVGPKARDVKPEEIVCAPLKALLKGMLRPDTMFRKPRPVNLGGFLSVMGQQIATPQGGERFGDKSYAIISDRYMNFSSRVGYHYSVLDAYCGETSSKNYISFSFQGGAAGEIRRVRRCKAIAMVLEALGFTVVQQKDMVKSRFQKYPASIIEDRMDQLGRLLQVTRQMDMLMTDDASVVQFKNDFMQGNYQ